MSKYVNLKVDDWFSLFSEIENKHQAIFWMAKIESQTQKYEEVFVNDAYEKIFGHPKDELYNDVYVLRNYLVSEGKDQYVDSWVQRHYQDKKIESLYAIKCRNGDVVWMRDRVHTIYDQNNKPLFAAGIAVEEKNNLKLSESENQGQYKHQVELALNDYNDRLQEYTNLNIRAESSDVFGLSLSKREFECAELVAAGYSAKEIALMLSLSHRTIQDYINSLKTKLQARNIAHLAALLVKHNII